ncbi:MAG: hypothetical protein EBR09_08980 [Proteobacteria bacterium]|nr:hypothetical protein [Pseudomonadota bacterium]
MTFASRAELTAFWILAGLFIGIFCAPAASAQDSKNRQSNRTSKAAAPAAKVVVPDSLSLSKVYPFKPRNIYYASGALTLPLRTHSGANGISFSAGLRRGLFDFFATYLNETRVWRQLEQRPTADAYENFKKEFTSDEPDKIKGRAHLLKFQWSSGDLFSLWGFEGGFGLRYPAPLLPDDFTANTATFISLGGLSEVRVVGVKYTTRGAGLKMLLAWNVPQMRSLNVISGFRYTILEASPNGFKDAADQLSVHAFGMMNGVEWQL